MHLNLHSAWRTGSLVLTDIPTAILLICVSVMLLCVLCLAYGQKAM